MRAPRKLGVVVAMLLLLAACEQGDDGTDGDTSTSEPSEEESEGDMDSDGGDDEGFGCG